MKEAVAGLRQPLMSALGQKRTLKHVQSMSALPAKADIRQLSEFTTHAIADAWVPDA
jgi:hypothetical protein